MPLQVHSDHVVPFLLGHVEDHAIAQDAGDVDEDVEFAELLNSLIHQALAAFDGCYIHMIGDRVAATGFDFLGDIVGWRGRFLLPRNRDADVVDHDCASLRGECPRDAAANTAAAAGDRGYLTVELAHRLNLPWHMMAESKRAQCFGSYKSAYSAKLGERNRYARRSRESASLFLFGQFVRIGKDVFGDVAGCC